MSCYIIAELVNSFRNTLLYYVSEENFNDAQPLPG